MGDYAADNYGTCELGANCYWLPGCLKLGWQGRDCPHWKALDGVDVMKLRLSLGLAKCAKCGCKTQGETALVDGEIWCHPCADQGGKS